jgi:hypothetical protein
MATTTNFGWTTPNDTDLVKDGAAAIRTALNGVDTSFVDLKGGTTGQVLAKASNTDLDYSWVAQDDSNAIQNAIVDAKGDLITATADDTPARLAVGTNGQFLTADSSAATGLAWGSAGGMTLLSTTTLSGATTTISSISGAYTNLAIFIDGITYSTNAYPRIAPNNITNISSYVGNDGGGGQLELNGYINMAEYNWTAANSTNVAGFLINNYSSTTARKSFQIFGTYHEAAPGATRVYQWSGGIDTTSAITSLVFSTTAGTFSGGTVLIYGVK